MGTRIPTVERPKLITEALDLDRQYHNAEIAERMGVTIAQVKHLLHEGRNGKATGANTPVFVAGGNGNGHEPACETAPVLDGEDVHFVSADDKRAALARFLGTTWQPARIHVSRPTKTRTVCAVGDVHGDFDEAVLASLIDSQADVYILAGDTLDQHAANSHGTETPTEYQERAAQTIRSEAAAVRAALELLLDNVPGEIKLFMGNHDSRSWRKLSEVYPWMADLYRDPLDALIAGLGERVKRVGHPVRYYLPNGACLDGHHLNEFMYVFGDAVFSHLNFTTSQTETAVKKLFRQWWVNWEHRLRLTHVQVIVHFHTHARALDTQRGGYMLLVEPGMGGKLDSESYKLGYAARWKPGIQGYCRMVQIHEGDDWKTDLASVELVAPSLAREGR